MSVIRVTGRYAAAPERVFGAWLDSGRAGRWLFATASHPVTAVTIDPRAGGSFAFVDRRDGTVVSHTGRYVEIRPPRRLSFTLSGAPHAQGVTRVTVEIAPLKKGCTLTLIHEDVPRNHTREMRGRWTGILFGLGVMLDTASTGFPHDQE